MATIKFYTPEEENEVKRLFSLPESKERKQSIKDYAAKINRKPGQLYAKAYSLGVVGNNHPEKSYKNAGRTGNKKHKTNMHVVPKNSGRTNGSEVRFKVSGFSFDNETNEVVFRIGR